MTYKIKDELYLAITDAIRPHLVEGSNAYRTEHTKLNGIRVFVILIIHATERCDGDNVTTERIRTWTNIELTKVEVSAYDDIGTEVEHNFNEDKLALALRYLEGEHGN